jgi:hypothetical protein
MIRTELLSETQHVLAELEACSGYPVSFVADPTLLQAATVIPASTAEPVHEVHYRPQAEAADYPIAFEAGLALRACRHAPERRFRLAAADERREALGKEIGKLHRKLPPQVFRALAAQVLDGMLQQIGQCPTGILIDRWLHDDFPALRAPQASALREQLDINASCLMPEYAEQFPQSVVYANCAMNAAYAFAASDLLGDPALAEPYRAAGLEEIATALLTALPAPDAQSLDDRALISAWADMLRISDWLQWLPADDTA